MKFYELKYRCYDETPDPLKNHYIYERWEIDPIKEIDADNGDQFNKYDGYQEWTEVCEDKEEAEELMQEIIDGKENVVICK